MTGNRRGSLVFAQIRAYDVGSIVGGSDMAGKLTALGVAKLKTPGMYCNPQDQMARAG